MWEKGSEGAGSIRYLIFKITETLVLGDYRDQSVTLGASGRDDVKRRPRTEGSGGHVATEVTRRTTGQGLMKMTRSQGLKSSMYEKPLGVSDEEG